MNLQSFDDLINKTNFRAFVLMDDIVLGKQYDEDKIVLIEKKQYQSLMKYFHFEVDDEVLNTYYDVMIFMNDTKSIYRTTCDCKDYRRNRSCCHIAAVFYYYYKILFDVKEYDFEKISKDILKEFLPSNNGIKKEVNVLLNINIEMYYGSYKRIVPKILIGVNKLYTMGNHFNDFRTAFERGKGEVYFGKEFTYNPEEYYFSEDALKIINAYIGLNDSYGRYRGYYSDNEMKKFISKLKDVKFTYNNYQMDGIVEGFGINTKLAKDNDNYELSFDLDNLECVIDDDYEYIVYKGVMYHLKGKEQDLLSRLDSIMMEKIVIPNDNFDLFTKGLLGVVKKNLEVDSSASDIVIPKEIVTELYFDLRNNYILVNPKFKYGNVDVGYFDDDSKVLRDLEEESKVINDLIKWGFVLEDKKIVLKDIDDQVEFMEQGLEQIALKYIVYTTEKYKSVGIKKKTNVSSMFGIGKDNILSYNFDLGDIKSDELVNIFKEIKSKGKYYRLKNGDILNLEDESLVELSNLAEEMEFSDDDIRNGHGSILKYRAIYLDSLKNNKYNIIKTDNLFDELMDKFYKFKDAPLTISSQELKVLRDYQLVGVKWLYNLARTGFGGILADEMGLGKTIQVIYYLKQMLKDNKDSKFLIVVPTSLAYNWDHEFMMYAPEIKRIIYVGAKDKRMELLKEDYNVIVTTYGLLREDSSIFDNMSFNTMIIDEAQNIKNNMAGITKCVKQVKAETKFALTGTPIENNVLELWSIFDFVMPGYLGSLTKFQSKYKIKDFNEDSEVLIKGLSRVINPFILRRKKMDVIKELPKKLVNDIYIDMSSEQKKLYVAELERVKNEMDKIMEDGNMSKARFLILQLLTKLRQICIDPHILYDNYEEESGKIERLINIIKEYILNGHKILVFTSFRTALNIVKDKLEENNIKSYIIDGSVSSKKRMDLADSFNEDGDVKVFLIMLRAGGTGLNLMGADVVIHLDLWWNPQAENQATDRAHRIGQKNMVEVIHLIMKGTIEEKILELQNKKRVLSDKLIDGEVRDKNILNELSREDIENLLSYENKD